ncbi:MAG: helix-hairpin-helix domain-containing protein, partial [Pseudomonadota bacterium]
AAKAAKAESADSSAEADADVKAATAQEAKTEAKAAEEKPAKAEKPAAKKEEAAEASAAPLFTAPAGGEKDKLTDIKGIGPVAERQLNEQGITTFAQIAALTDEDIERVDEYMPFSADQIRDWQAQAKDKA